jgi:DNA-binding transcriptional LysR family regulator
MLIGIMLRFARSFCVLAEELHFGRAAARLHVTQPALSHQMKALERDIGCALLRRTSHQVALTEAGAVLASALGAALDQVNRAVQQAVDVARGEAGALAVGYCELPLAGGLADTVQRFARLYPQVSVTLHSMPTNDQVAALLGGSIDIGFVHPPLDGKPLTLRPAGGESMVAALPRTHPSARGTTLHLRDLAGERLICCSEAGAPHMYRAMLAACARAGFTPRLGAEDKSWHAMVNQAAAGLGVALVPASLAASTAPHMLFLPVEGLDLTLQTAIATAPGKLRPAVAGFLALCPA